jgi:predicted RNA methylase
VTAFSALTALAVSALLALGCGDDDEAEPAPASSGTASTTISIAEAARSPKNVTCKDIQTESEAAAKAALAAANTLAGTVQIRAANRYQTTQRLLFAIYDLCERIDDGSYRPAADALEGVKSGRYQLGG